MEDPALDKSGLSVDVKEEMEDPALDKSGLSVDVKEELEDPALDKSGLSVDIKEEMEDPALGESGLSVDIKEEMEDPALDKSGLSVDVKEELEDPALDKSGLSVDIKEEMEDPALGESGLSVDVKEEMEDPVLGGSQRQEATPVYEESTGKHESGLSVDGKKKIKNSVLEFARIGFPNSGCTPGTIVKHMQLRLWDVTTTAQGQPAASKRGPTYAASGSADMSGHLSTYEADILPTEPECPGRVSPNAGCTPGTIVNHMPFCAFLSRGGKWDFTTTAQGQPAASKRASGSADMSGHLSTYEPDILPTEPDDYGQLFFKSSLPFSNWNDPKSLIQSSTPLKMQLSKKLSLPGEEWDVKPAAKDTMQP
ncbi:hypothetical protein UPYG_G00054300, partial [Umbra pygmaea]